MITMIAIFLFGIVMYASAGDGEWGTFAIAALLIVGAIVFCSVGRKCDRAYGNFIDHWGKR